MSFGKWYDEQKAGEAGEGGGSSLFGNLGIEMNLNSDQLLPLYEGMQPVNFQNIRAGMEAQMPKKVLGMGYQQRFKVNTVQWDLLFLCVFVHSCSRTTSDTVSLTLFLVSCITGLYGPIAPLSSLFRPRIWSRNAHDHYAPTKVCHFVHDGIPHVHGKFCHFEGTQGTHPRHVRGRSHVLHDNLCRQYAGDAVLYV